MIDVFHPLEDLLSRCRDYNEGRYWLPRCSVRYKSAVDQMYKSIAADNDSRERFSISVPISEHFDKEENEIIASNEFQTLSFNLYDTLDETEIYTDLPTSFVEALYDERIRIPDHSQVAEGGRIITFRDALMVNPQVFDPSHYASLGFKTKEEYEEILDRTLNFGLQIAHSTVIEPFFDLMNNQVLDEEERRAGGFKVLSVASVDLRMAESFYNDPQKRAQVIRAFADMIKFTLKAAERHGSDTLIFPPLGYGTYAPSDLAKEIAEQGYRLAFSEYRKNLDKNPKDIFITAQPPLEKWFKESGCDGAFQKVLPLTKEMYSSAQIFARKSHKVTVVNAANMTWTCNALNEDGQDVYFNGMAWGYKRNRIYNLTDEALPHIDPRFVVLRPIIMKKLLGTYAIKNIHERQFDFSRFTIDQQMSDGYVTVGNNTKLMAVRHRERHGNNSIHKLLEIKKITLSLMKQFNISISDVIYIFELSEKFGGFTNKMELIRSSGIPITAEQRQRYGAFSVNFQKLANKSDLMTPRAGKEVGFRAKRVMSLFNHSPALLYDFLTQDTSQEEKKYRKSNRKLAKKPAL